MPANPAPSDSFFKALFEIHLRESAADNFISGLLLFREMRILFVHDRFGAQAGAEANVYIAATELKRRCHTVGIIHGPSTENNIKAWQETFADRYPLQTKRNRKIVQAALDEFSPDVVYVHKMSDNEILQTLVDSGLPLVHMVHDHDIYCMRSYRYFYFSRKICTRAASPYCVFPCGAFIAKNSGGSFPIKFVSYLAKRREIQLNKRFHKMIVVTNYMRDELLRNGFDATKIEIHAPAPRMVDAKIQSKFTNRNLILYAGQIIRGKGVDVLLESLALLKTPFECIILGDGSHRAYCEELSRRLGLNDRVHFRGFVPQDELKNFYSECSVFVISSVWPEPYATVGIEACRFGIPVVAFDVGGIGDWLHDGSNGFLVPVMDRDLFAERVGQLLQDKELARKMGERGRSFANQKYDFTNYITRLEQILGSVVNFQPSPSLDVAAA